MSYDGNISLHKAQEIVKNFDGSFPLNAKERKNLGHCVSIIEQSKDVPKRVRNKLLKVKEDLLEHDVSILKGNLAKINNATKKGKAFYIYQRDNEVKVKVLGKHAGKLEKMRFQSKKALSHDIKLIEKLVADGRRLAERDEAITPLLLRMQPFVANEKVLLGDKFFKKKKSVQTLQSLNKALNELQLLRTNKTSLWAEEFAERGQSEYEKTVEEEKVPTLIGLSIASMVEDRFGSRITPRDNYFARGGYAIMATLLEKNLIERVLEEDSLTEVEKEKVNQYLDDINRSLDLNFMINYNSSTHVPSKNQGLIAQAAWQKILGLEGDEAVHLDLGYHAHSMRASFRQVDGEIVIRLYDTSGGLELLKSGNPIKGLFHVLTGQKQYVAMELKVPMLAFEEKGAEYLQNLIAIDTCIEGKAEADLPGYKDFYRVFTSIAPSYELVVKKKPQTTHNCFALRVLPAELDHFGHDLYKKVRKSSLEQIYVQLVEEYKKSLLDQYTETGYSERQALLRIERKIEKFEQENPLLSSKELNRTKDYLAKMASDPTNNEDWFYCLRILRHKIAK